MQQVVSLAEGAAVHFAIRTKLRIGVTPGLKAPAPPSPQTVSPHSPRRKCVSRCLGTKGVFFFLAESSPKVEHSRKIHKHQRQYSTLSCPTAEYLAAFKPALVGRKIVILGWPLTTPGDPWAVVG
uniref:Uncharacterized protein n=1 Tax=Eutreptiella gymnastica TaxID=73025 RepID=A0A7S4CS97_9EUGL